MLEHVSPEVIIHILHHSEYSTILRFAATCKTYYELIAQSTSLQLHIELESNGLELVKGSSKGDATYWEILEDLRRFHDAWLDLKVGHPIVRPLGRSDMLLWELREGFYVKGFSRSGGNYADTLQFVPLDAAIPDPPPIAFDFSFNEFTVDPAQGLVAIMFRDQDQDLQSILHIHLCSSTTGLAHPLAQYPKLTAEFESICRVYVSDFAIEIMGDMLLTRISRNSACIYEVLIWNWKSGTFLTRISSRIGICDTFFLDRQHLVLQTATCSSHTHLDTLALLVYAIPNGDSAHNDFPREYLKVADLSVAQPILRLEFPQINQSFVISVNGFLLHSDPVPGRILYTKSAAFSCSYATTLGMAFSFGQVNGGWDEPPYYRVFVDGKFLLDQIHSNANVHGETRVLPWASWGIYVTRWFISSYPPDHWVSWMSASRFLMASSDPPYYCVFDFSSLSIHPLRDRLASSQPGSCGHKIIGVKWLDDDIHRIAENPMHGHELTSITVGKDSPNVFYCDNGLAFDEPIESRLPYRLAFRRLTEMSHEGLQIVGDCIVGVNTWGPSSENITIYKIEEEVASGTRFRSQA